MTDLDLNFTADGVQALTAKLSGKGQWWANADEVCYGSDPDGDVDNSPRVATARSERDARFIAAAPRIALDCLALHKALEERDKALGEALAEIRAAHGWSDGAVSDGWTYDRQQAAWRKNLNGKSAIVWSGEWRLTYTPSRAPPGPYIDGGHAKGFRDGMHTVDGHRHFQPKASTPLGEPATAPSHPNTSPDSEVTP